MLKRSTSPQLYAAVQRVPSEAGERAARAAALKLIRRARQKECQRQDSVPSVTLEKESEQLIPEEAQDLKISDPEFLPYSHPEYDRLNPRIGYSPFAPYSSMELSPSTWDRPPNWLPAVSYEVDSTHFLRPLVEKTVGGSKENTLEKKSALKADAPIFHPTCPNLVPALREQPKQDPLLDYASSESIVGRLLTASRFRPESGVQQFGVIHLSFVVQCLKRLLDKHIEFNPELGRIVLRQNSDLRLRGKELGLPVQYHAWLCGEGEYTGKIFHVNIEELREHEAAWMKKFGRKE